MRTLKTLCLAATLALAGPAMAGDPAAKDDPSDRSARVLSSLSAAAVIDAKLLPAARSGVAAQAKTWHRGAQRRLEALPACGAGRAAVACVETEPATLAERSSDRPPQRDNAGAAPGPQTAPAVLAP